MANRNSGKNDGQVMMIKNNGQVEAYQVRCPPLLRADVADRVSGNRLEAHGSRLDKLSMLSDQVESSFTKAKSTITYLMLMSRRECLL